MLQEGTYSNCRIVSAVLAESEYGPQIVVDVEVAENTKRQVYLGMGEEAIANGDVPFRDYTKPVLDFLVFNGDFGAIQFEKTEGLDCYCKHKANKDGELKERWFINTGRFDPEPAGQDVARRFNAKWKAMSGPPSKPAGAPAKPPASPSRSPAQAKGPPAAAPKPSGPPPAQPWDKDRAWAVWENVSNENKANAENWHAVIEGFKKPEDEFTADDWKKVAEAADIPF